MRSMRRELVLRITVGTALMLLAASVFLGAVIRRLDMHEFDSGLEATARTLATLVLHDSGRLEVEFAGEYMPEFETEEEPEYFQFRLPDGTVIERSDRLGDQDLPFLSSASELPRFLNLELPDGRQGRLVQISFSPRLQEAKEGAERVDGESFVIPMASSGEPVHVILSVARGLEDLHHLLLSIYITLGVMDTLLVCLIGLFVSRTMLKGFAPVADMNTRIRALDPKSLDQRVRLPNAPVELQTVLSALDGFIDKLQAAFAREQRFTSDVAHELRTPLAEFRLSCEVGEKWSDDSALVARRFQELLSSSAHMERMVYSLLELTRCDAGMVQPSCTEVRIAESLDSIWNQFEKTTQERRLCFANGVDKALILETDQDRLGMILQNLIGNAVEYGMSGTDVVCTCCTDANNLRISIRNQTQGLEDVDMAHVFERFWRKDPARTGGSHTGLGLSLAKALAETLGLTLGASLSSSGVFTAYLTFPQRAIR